MNDKELERAKINHFKQELKSMKYLINQSEEYLKLFEEADHKLNNIKSPFTNSSEKGSSNSTFDQRFSYWLSKKQKAMYDHRRYQARVDEIICTLEMMDPIERRIITDIYMKGYTFDYISMKYAITRNELQNLVDKTISYYLTGMQNKKCRTRGLL